MIIKSILDTDLYKFTTSYAYMKLFPQARGTFEFIDRDNTEYPEVYFDSSVEELREVTDIMYALRESIALTPTDGLGISNSDLEQIGAKDYATVDDILSRFIPFEDFRKSYDSAGQIMHPHDEMAESDCWSQLCARHGEDVVNKVWGRHLASEFKRKKAPIYISRKLYE